MLIFLRWSLSPHESYPFCFDVQQHTTIGELCKMVLTKNNQWYGNPTFSVVKIYDEDTKLLDENSTISMCFDNTDDRYLVFVAG